MSIKYVSLLILAVQNSALILVMRYSRTLAGPKYIPTTAVLLSETIETVLSFFVLLCIRWRSRSKSITSATTPAQQPSRNVFRQLFDDLLHVNVLVPITVLAFLYTIQNNLQYVGASNLDAATFQVLSQGEILTTALFAIVILHKKLTAVKWSAILVLTIGLVFISWRSSPAADTGKREIEVGSHMVGVSAILLVCVLSGFTCVLYEHILKKGKNPSSSSSTQLWMRNVQLGVTSVLTALMATCFLDGKQIVNEGFFYGYNYVVWTTITLHAVGGVIIAIVINYADNILKGFATSLSLMFSTAISAMTGDVILTYRFVFGVVLVLAATNIYGLSSRSTTEDHPEDDESLLSDSESQEGSVELDEKDFSEKQAEDVIAMAQTHRARQRSRG